MQFKKFCICLFAQNFWTAPEVPHRFARYHPAMESGSNLQMFWSCLLCINYHKFNIPEKMSRTMLGAAKSTNKLGCIIGSVKSLTPLSRGQPKVDLNDVVLN